MFENWETELGVIGMVAIGGLLGSIIGLEREFAGKPAGLRTHTLVGAAATLLMCLGRIIIDSYDPGVFRNYLTIDPIRVMQAIVIGISFLGAGTIFRQRNDEIEGLTTAASILFTSGIGIAVGLDQLVIAAGLTILAVLVLAGVGFVERGLAHRRDPREGDEGRPHPPRRRNPAAPGPADPPDRR